ncbi:peptidyl-prolyl cis-trans isomerase FKBP11 [Diretmus argenteus]
MLEATVGLIQVLGHTGAACWSPKSLKSRRKLDVSAFPPVFFLSFFPFTMKTEVFLLALAFTCALAQDEQNAIGELLVESLEKPETCSVLSAMGDTLQIHYTGKLMDGKVIDSSLSRDPLAVELGKRTVIPGLEQSLVGVCEGQKIKATIPSHLAYGKRGYPPTIPGDAALEFEVEVISLIQQTPWQKMVNDVFPLVCLGLVPTLLGMVGLYLYKKAQNPSKKKAKDKKSKKK